MSRVVFDIVVLLSAVFNVVVSFLVVIFVVGGVGDGVFYAKNKKKLKFKIYFERKNKNIFLKNTFGVGFGVFGVGFGVLGVG